jgi:hypothetical protein
MLGSRSGVNSGLSFLGLSNASTRFGVDRPEWVVCTSGLCFGDKCLEIEGILLNGWDMVYRVGAKSKI